MRTEAEVQRKLDSFRAVLEQPNNGIPAEGVKAYKGVIAALRWYLEYEEDVVLP